LIGLFSEDFMFRLFIGAFCGNQGGSVNAIDSRSGGYPQINYKIWRNLAVYAIKGARRPVPKSPRTAEFQRLFRR
jgi:hypothetical protein